MNHLNAKEKNVVFMNALFAFGMTMGNVFVNVFVYSYTQSLEITLIYACVRYLFIPFFSVMAGKLSARFDLTRILSLGLSMMVVSFLMLLWVQGGIKDAVWKAYVNAAIIGGGEGLFWFAMNIMNQKTARVEARALFLSSIGFFNGLSNILAPIFTAIILANVDTEMFGYRLIFAAVIMVFICVVAMSSRLSYAYRSDSFPLLSLFKKGTMKWEYHKQTSILHSIRECYTMALSGLLVFRLLDNSGELLSYYNALVSAILIISYWVVGRKVRHNRIVSAMYVGGLGQIVAMLILSFSASPWMALTFGIINAISFPLYQNGFQMIRMRVFSEEGKGGNITGHIIASEFLLNLGRIIGLGTVVILARFLADPAYIQVGTIIMVLGAIGVLILTFNLSRKFELI